MSDVINVTYVTDLTKIIYNKNTTNMNGMTDETDTTDMAMTMLIT